LYYPDYQQYRTPDGRRIPLAVLYGGNLYRVNGDVLNAPYGTKNLRSDKRTEIQTLLPDAIDALPVSGSTDNAPSVPSEPDAQPTEPTPVSGLFDSVISTAVGEAVARGIGADVAPAVARYVIDQLGYEPRKVEITRPDGSVGTVEGITHDVFDDVIAWLLAGENVWLKGAAGSGKSTLALQVSEALGVPFKFANAITDVYAQLTGFRTADGTVIRTDFRDGWEFGGLIFIDEFDASIPEATTFVNTALENGYCAFPDRVIDRHENAFVMVGANTSGTGADLQYSARYKLDEATRDRFVEVHVGYMDEIENGLAGTDDDGNPRLDVADFVRDFRNALTETGTNALATPRATRRIGKLVDTIPDARLVQQSMTKHLSVDDLTVIRTKMTGSGRWYTALDNVIAGRF
jgi:hypothetical protein